MFVCCCIVKILSEQLGGKAMTQYTQDLIGHSIGLRFVMLKPPRDTLKDHAGDEACQ